jgi:L-iditol 2-dehydrogenase
MTSASSAGPRRLVVTGPGELVVADSPRQAVTDGHARVAIAYAGICHTDEFLLDGSHPAARYPVVPGHELSGVVTETSTTTTRLSVGDRVAVMSQLTCGHCPACHCGALGRCAQQRELGSTLDGGWQSEIVVPDWAAVTVPDDVPLRIAALTEPSANALAATRAAAVHPRDDVAIFGPGAIGLLTLAQVRRRTAGRIILIGTASDEMRLALGKQMGADHVASAGDAVAAIMEITAGRGVDVVVQCAPSLRASAAGFEALAQGGRLIVEGYTSGGETIAIPPARMVERELSIRGMRGWTAQDFRDAVAGLATPGANLTRLITNTYRLDDHQAALSRARDITTAIKVMFANVDGPADLGPGATS